MNGTELPGIGTDKDNHKNRKIDHTILELQRDTYRCSNRI